MKKLILFSLFLLFSTTYSITLDEALSIAEKNATNIKLNAKDIEKAELQIKEAKSSILPQINLTGSYTRWDPNYISGFTPKNQYNAKIGLNQKIFDYQIFNLIKIAKENMELYKVIKEDIHQQIKDTTRRLFLVALANKEILKLKEESLKYWQVNAKYIEEKYKAGLLAKYDYMRAFSQLKSSEADYEIAKTNYEKSIEDLKRFLMVEDITPPEGRLDKFSFTEDVNIENSTSLKVLKSQINLAQKQIEYQQSTNYPSLSAFINYQVNNQIKFPQNEEIWKKGYNLGISLNWQIFDGFAKDSRVLQSKIDKSKYEVSLQDKTMELKTTLNKTKADLKSLEIQLIADEENLKVAQEALRLSTERFKSNITNIVEVLDSQNNYLLAQLKYINNLYNYNQKVYDLMNLNGK